MQPCVGSCIKEIIQTRTRYYSVIHVAIAMSSDWIILRRVRTYQSPVHTFHMLISYRGYHLPAYRVEAICVLNDAKVFEDKLDLKVGVASLYSGSA